MPDKILPFIDLFITGFASVFALVFSFGFVPIIVAVLNGIYIVARIKRDADKYNKGSIWLYLKSIIKKN